MNFDDVLAQEEYLFMDGSDAGRKEPLDLRGLIANVSAHDCCVCCGKQAQDGRYAGLPCCHKCYETGLLLEWLEQNNSLDSAERTNGEIMKYEIQERICDECGKKEQMKMIARHGATPFYGWIRAHIEGSDGLSSCLDFCSSACAGKHFTLFTEVLN